MRTYSIGEYMIGLDETRNNMIGRIRRGSRNIVDNYDAGRGMQLSVYGPPDGSLWNSQPWALNAIEGGHWLGGSETTVSPVRTPNNVLSWVSHGVHWATGERLPYLFEHHVSSINGGKALRLNLSSRYVGGGLLPIPARHQEVPALFMPRNLDKLFLSVNNSKPEVLPAYTLPTVPPLIPAVRDFGGFAPFTLYAVDTFGNGVCLSGQAEALCWYQFGKMKETSACSYIAPLVTFGYGETWSGSVDLTIGNFTNRLK